MSSSTPAELSAAAIIKQVDDGAYPRDLVVNFARGFLPLEQEDVLAVLAHLSASADEEIAKTARASLAETPSKIVLTFASNEAGSADLLAKLARATSDAAVLEALIRNRTLSDESVADLARIAEPAVQDIIVINQSRIIRAPVILEALLENPRLTPDVRRRALESREEFFDKAARARAALAAVADLLEPDALDEPLDEVIELIELAEKEPPAPEPPAPPPSVVDEKEQSMWAKIQNMTVSQKVMLAFRGDKTVRMILVRARNRMVCAAAIRNPLMTLAEVESVAGMRNVEEEVLRIIGMRREWMAKYVIMSQIIRNPKAPVGVVLPLINRLTLRDLKGLKDDRNVTEVVRQLAKKAYLARTQKS